MVSDARPAGERPAPSAVDATRVMSLIDLTDLNDAHVPDGLERLVDRAVEFGCPAVCIWPEFVGDAAALLGGHTDGGACHIATVVNFPNGGDDVEAVLAEAGTALDAGADDIDLVLPYHSFNAGAVDTARTMVERVGELVHARSGRSVDRAVLKVILETGELADHDAVERAARLAVDAGADFIKSSTGKTAVSATIPAFIRMLEVAATADRTIGLKPSGGIRTVAEAMTYLDLVDARLGSGWAQPATFRFGASSLLDDAIAVADSA